MFRYLLLTFLLTSYAYPLEFRPIIGVERVQKVQPYPHTKSRLILGASVLVGPQFLSVEVEGTTGQDSENFPAQNMSIKEKVYNGMLGLRSAVDIALMNLYVRAGGHVRRREITTTENGVTTKEVPSTYVSPYAGAGFSLGPSSFKLLAGYTAIFIGRPQSNDIEHQYTIGIGIGF